MTKRLVQKGAKSVCILPICGLLPATHLPSMVSAVNAASTRHIASRLARSNRAQAGQGRGVMTCLVPGFRPAYSPREPGDRTAKLSTSACHPDDHSPGLRSYLSGQMREIHAEDTPVVGREFGEANVLVETGGPLVAMADVQMQSG